MKKRFPISLEVRDYDNLDIILISLARGNIQKISKQEFYETLTKWSVGKGKEFIKEVLGV